MSHQIGHSGLRPRATVESRANLSMDRPEALDHVITAGLVLGATRIEIRPRGQGYDASLPVEDLDELAQLAQRAAVQTLRLAAIEAINADLRNQRDYFDGLASTLQEQVDRLVAERDHARRTAIRARFGV